MKKFMKIFMVLFAIMSCTHKSLTYDHIKTINDIPIGNRESCQPYRIDATDQRVHIECPPGTVITYENVVEFLYSRQFH